ncbi:protein phosphatase 2C domain-containing protein [Streptomyces griseocarneus]|uniref:protein phosphatase 2C domain-containing protein n=1 Tax=Streptomyces griseocarneus TaxID=51201 RepID=UPI00167D1C57|nr:protein phosphatase 2C domain-containing protein [Streptomyces griseocarneus]MBZ6472639.1 protein phosphatase 2C domain-containing protein [Streptomyces griseocarneus]
MSQQGDHYAEQEDAWWRELYGRSEPDTAGAATGDSLDERFSSASAVVGPESARPRSEPRRPRVAEPPGGPLLPGPPSASPTGLSPALSRGVPRQTKRWPAAGNGSLPVPAHQPPGFDGGPELRPPAGPVPRPEGPPPPDPRTRVSPPPPSSLPVPRDAREPRDGAEAPGPAPAADGAGAADDAGIMDIAEVTGVAETTGGSPVTGTAEATDPAGTPGIASVKGITGTRGIADLALASGLPGVADASEAARAPGTAEASELPPPADRRPARRNGTRLRAAEFVGRRPPTYEAEPTAWPPADPGGLEDLVPDTVLDGARYGAMTLRAASLRGDSARFRGEPRRDALLTARFGAGEDALLLVAMASGARAAEGAHRAAREVCEWIGGAVGRSHARLAEDIHAGRRDELKSGLHRLTDRTYGRLRVRAAELGHRPSEYTAGLRCLLLPADVRCRTRVFFGVGAGGLFRLRDGAWQDMDPEPRAAEAAGELGAGGGAEAGDAYAPADRITVDLGIPTPGTTPVIDPDDVPSEPFRFRASVGRPGDTLLLCTAGLADPLRGEPELGVRLAERWAREEPPGLAEFLADAQLRVKGYADDRSACAVWEV